MTRNQLEAVVDAFVEIIDSWNDGDVDEDRGRSNNAICLTLWDDGSGKIGRRFSEGHEVEDFHEFDDIIDLVRVLSNEGIDVEGETW